MQTILIIDMSVYFRRAYYNQPMYPVSSLMDTLKTLLDVHHPHERIAALDYGRESWRNQIYPAYKGNRPPPDPAYAAEVPAMREMLDTLKIPCYERQGAEADDVIGSLCRELPDTYQKIICSPDKDLLQLVDDKQHVIQWDAAQTLTEATVPNKMGVFPRAIPDLLALAGDIVDNIPGVAGIGRKQAVSLLQEFGTLDSIYEQISELPTRTRTLLNAGRENAYLSKALATIKTDLNILGETATSNNERK